MTDIKVIDKKNVKLIVKKPSEPVKLVPGAAPAPEAVLAEGMAHMPAGIKGAVAEHYGAGTETVLPGGGEVGGPGLAHFTAHALVEPITPTLEKDFNKSTGSTFYVIGEDDDVKAAIRFWQETSSPDITVIAYRLRLTPKIEVLNFQHYMAAKYPEIKWIGVGQNHVSVSGATMFKAPAKHYDKVLHLMEENAIASKLYEMIAKCFPGIEFRITTDQFGTFFREEANRILNIPATPQELASSAVVFGFNDYKVKLEGGKEVDTAQEDVGL